MGKAKLACRVCGANSCKTHYDSFDLQQCKGREKTAFLMSFLEETLTSLASQRSRNIYLSYLYHSLSPLRSLVPVPARQFW